MSLFWLNGDIRYQVLGVPNATATQRRAKSYPIMGLYSPSLDAPWDPAVDQIPVIISGVEGAVTLNVDSVDFAALGLTSDAPWDGEAPEASTVGLQKFIALTMAEVWTTLQGTLKADVGQGYAPSGKAVASGVLDAIETAAESFTPLAGRGFNLLIGAPGASLGGSTVILERALDGVTFHPVTAGDGTPVSYTAGVNIVRGEDQSDVPYRLRCTVYGGTPIAWRISQ